MKDPSLYAPLLQQSWSGAAAARRCLSGSTMVGLLTAQIDALFIDLGLDLRSASPAWNLRAARNVLAQDTLNTVIAQLSDTSGLTANTRRITQIMRQHFQAAVRQHGLAFLWESALFDVNWPEGMSQQKVGRVLVSELMQVYLVDEAQKHCRTCRPCKRQHDPKDLVNQSAMIAISRTFRLKLKRQEGSSPIGFIKVFWKNYVREACRKLNRPREIPTEETPEKVSNASALEVAIAKQSLDCFRNRVNSVHWLALLLNHGPTQITLEDVWAACTHRKAHGPVRSPLSVWIGIRRFMSEKHEDTDSEKVEWVCWLLFTDSEKIPSLWWSTLDSAEQRKHWDRFRKWSSRGKLAALTTLPSDKLSNDTGSQS